MEDKKRTSGLPGRNHTHLDRRQMEGAYSARPHAGHKTVRRAEKFYRLGFSKGSDCAAARHGEKRTCPP